MKSFSGLNTEIRFYKVLMHKMTLNKNCIKDVLLLLGL